MNDARLIECRTVSASVKYLGFATIRDALKTQQPIIRFVPVCILA